MKQAAAPGTPLCLHNTSAAQCVVAREQLEARAGLHGVDVSRVQPPLAHMHTQVCALQTLILTEFEDWPADAITVEFWMLSADRCRKGVPFSYATGAYEQGDNSFLILNYNDWCARAAALWRRAPQHALPCQGAVLYKHPVVHNLKAGADVQKTHSGQVIHSAGTTETHGHEHAWVMLTACACRVFRRAHASSMRPTPAGCLRGAAA